MHSSIFACLGFDMQSISEAATQAAVSMNKALSPIEDTPKTIVIDYLSLMSDSKDSRFKRLVRL